MRGDEEDGGGGGVGSISLLCPLLSPLATTNHSAFPRGVGGPARLESVTRHREGREEGRRETVAVFRV